MNLPRRPVIFGIVVVAAIALAAMFYVIHMPPPGALGAAGAVAPRTTNSPLTSPEPMQVAPQQPQPAPSSSLSSLLSVPNVPALPPRSPVGTFHWVPVSQMSDWAYTIQGDEVYVRDQDSVLKVIPGANPSMFFVGYSYGPTEGPNSHDADATFYVTDGKQIYFLNDFEVSLQPVHGADLPTFEAPSNYTNSYYSNTNFAQDKQHVYLDSVSLPDADPNTFTIIEDDGGDFTGYFKDATHVWFRDYNSTDTALADPQIALLSSTDPATLTALPSDRILEGIEPPFFAIDKYYVYSSGDIIDGADPRTFELLCFPSIGVGTACNPPYAKDAKHVWSITYATSSPDGGDYYGDFQLISEADPATFHFADPTVCNVEQLPCPYDAFDKSHKYLAGQIVN
jgi:hypothetical protein